MNVHVAKSGNLSTNREREAMTTNRTRLVRLAAGAAASLLLLSACGDGGEGETATSGASEESSTSDGEESTEGGGAGEDSPEFVEFREAEPGSGEA